MCIFSTMASCQKHVKTTSFATFQASLQALGSIAFHISRLFNVELSIASFRKKLTKLTKMLGPLGFEIIHTSG